MNSNLFLIEEKLVQSINRCQQNDNWEQLQNLIFSVFSDRQNLSSSFLRKGFPLNISLDYESSSSASATPKSKRKLVH